MIWFQLVCAVAAAVTAPLLLVIVRHEVRFARLRALFEFDVAFGMASRPVATDYSERAPDVARPPPEPPHKDPPPTFEYVRSRYTDDIVFPDHFPHEWIRKFDMRQPEFRAFVRSLRWWQMKSSTAILLSAIPLTAMIAYGFALLFTGAPDLGVIGSLIGMQAPPLVTGAAVSSAGAQMLNHNLAVVTEAAFLGGFLFVLGVMLRATMTFDLSPQTILRVTVYFVTGIVATAVAYLAFPDLPAQAWRTGAEAVSLAERATGGATAPGERSTRPTLATDDNGFDRALLLPVVARSADAVPPSARPAAAPAKAAPQDPPGAVKPVSRVWLVVAFLLAFVPDMAVNFMIIRVVNFGLRIKTTDGRLQDANKSTPLEIVDGIDVLTRFRLNEANIFEVQHLAVINPLMLFIETPFGIYQVIDWVAQAQLCLAVGPRRFLALQNRSIRTIFDLERAVLSVYTTSQVRRFVASLLLSSLGPGPSKLDVRDYSRLPPPHPPHPSTDPAGPRNAEAFSKYIADLFSESAKSSNGVDPCPDPEESIKHLVRSMVDDLHVCRLRQVWQQIFRGIDGPQPLGAARPPSERLWDTEWPPLLPASVKAPVGA